MRIFLTAHFLGLFLGNWQDHRGENYSIRLCQESPSLADLVLYEPA